jgi:hypothetical protein
VSTYPVADRAARGGGASPVGEQFARAIAAGDRRALLSLLAPHPDFRAMTPSRFWEADSATQVVDVMLGTWFGGERRVDAVEQVECDRVGGLERVGYRFLVTTSEGPAVVEQQAYLGVEDGRIASIRIMCTGLRPVVG